MRLSVAFLLASVLVGLVACTWDGAILSAEGNWEGPSEDAVAGLKHDLLGFVNDKRAENGVRPLKPGSNPSPQIHAEHSLRGCYSSHWDEWGMKPLYRYALAGGSQYAAENAGGMSYCAGPDDGYGLLGPVERSASVKRAVEGWMKSPGHRRTLLDPRHTTMHAGMAFGPYNMMIYQVFSGEYVVWEQAPAISEAGVLTASGLLNHSRWLPRSMSKTVVSIDYHPPTHRLDRGQLVWTYCLENDVRAGVLLFPLTPAAFYTDRATGERFRDYAVEIVENKQCVNPYELPEGRPGPNSVEAGLEWHDIARKRSRDVPPEKSKLFNIVARDLRYSESKQRFVVEATIAPMLDHYGPGVYTVVLWGHTAHGFDVIAKYPIWWQTEPTPGHPY